jgi:serine/threonine-protein kinase
MSNVVRQGNYIYLHINKEWYEYNESSAPIGAGAMGVVYLGKNCRNGQRVAIKMVREEYANNFEIRNRAKTEASLMFMHRNLIEMLGYCELYPNRGPMWIVSKFVQGITIDKFLRSQHYPDNVRSERIVKMFFSVLDALTYLHSKGICHLDIKPSNIIVEGGHNVRLLDLGIADIATEQIQSREGIQMSHGYMGTPNYAAPEQFSKNSKLTAATDIYEAGVSLYELLTGKNPFAAHTLQDTINKHLSVVLPYDNNVSSPLLEVLRKATYQQQGFRYQTAETFKQDLQLVLTMSQSSHSHVWAIIPVIIISIMLIISMLVIYFKFLQ